jgi:hypothetical protein
MDMKIEIVRRVHLVERLKREREELWTKANGLVVGGHIDDAISLLNRYFGIKEELEGAEAGLESLLKGHFSDR